MNGYSWGERSKRLIAQLHPQAVRVLERWMSLLNSTEGAPDVRIVETARSPAQAAANAARGVGIVHSKHVPGRDGYARAWDFQIVGSDPYNRAKLDIAISLMLKASDQLGIPIRSGGDWDMDGIPTERDASEKGNIADHVHGELLESHEKRYQEWFAARDRRRLARANGERFPR